jgi:hypothetical protein
MAHWLGLQFWWLELGLGFLALCALFGCFAWVEAENHED